MPRLVTDDFQVTSPRKWQSPKTGTVCPLDCTIRVPSANAELRLFVLLDNQELVTTRSTGIAYWEGAVRVEGTWKGKTVRGKSYVELSGYQEKYRPNV